MTQQACQVLSGRSGATFECFMHLPMACVFCQYFATSLSFRKYPQVADLGSFSVKNKNKKILIMYLNVIGALGIEFLFQISAHRKQKKIDLCMHAQKLV